MEEMEECRGWSRERVEALNAERHAELQRIENEYNPATGRGASGPRVAVDGEWMAQHCPKMGKRALKSLEGLTQWIPEQMVQDVGLGKVKTAVEWNRLRMKYDFEFWAVTCVKIKDKNSGERIALRLNRAQRRMLETMERRRRSGEPVRVVLLKARQWGGSTLVQMYMAWIQCVIMRNWNSLICTHVGRASASIRGMFDDMLATYPKEYWMGDAGLKDEARGKSRERKDEGEELKMVAYQGQRDIRMIPGRGCKVTLGSSESQDAIRGADYAMAHLSEVAFWKDTPQSTPADFIRAISGAVGLLANSLIVLESTANGVGNFFYEEYQRAVNGQSDKDAVFVPWCEIGFHTKPLGRETSEWAFFRSLNAYEFGLWTDHGCTLEQINWYRHKRREYSDDSQMMAECPTTALEAFNNTGRQVFSREGVDRLSRGCCKPAKTGEVVTDYGSAPMWRQSAAVFSGARFVEDSTGRLQVWALPEADGSYVVSVDVGGRTVKADWSVVAVIRADGERPEVVAQWNGHAEHDVVAWTAGAVATLYNKALLVIESNSLETDSSYDAEGRQGLFLLNELYSRYDNLYERHSPGQRDFRLGFHTNRATKEMIITELAAAIREGAYTERDHKAVAEFATYQRLPNGGYGARRGFHDDIVMTRAIGLHVVREQLGTLGDDDLRRWVEKRRKLR